MARSDGRRALFAIPAWRPFADDLAAGLIARHPAPEALARVVLLLPTRRAIRTLTEAFVRQSEGQALLLPRMVPAGDLDPEEMEGWEGGPLLAGLDGPAEALAPIAPDARRVALAKLLAARQPAPEALALAGQLAAVLDTLEIEGVRAADIADAVPAGDLQAHWAANAQVLRTVAELWPALLAERGLLDASRHRNLQLDALAARWAAQPPPFPVILAGFASAPPAVARLARTIARLPDGAILMPGLDGTLDAASWAVIAGDATQPGQETHPQFGMARFLAAAGLSPLEAEPWPHRGRAPGSDPARAALVARALLPPALSGASLPPPPPEALAGVTMAEAANPAEEALLIALALRQVVERPGQTAALVTPDRALARRVQVQLKRFGIEIDDSAGRPLAETAPGSLFVALATAAGERFAPVALLSALQHPLVRTGDDRLAWLNEVRRLDRLALRGIRPGPGLAGIAARLRQRPGVDDALRDWWHTGPAQDLAPLDAAAPLSAAALVDRLRSVAEALAGQALWQGDAGRALTRLIDGLAACRADLEAITVAPAEWAAFVVGLLQGVVVRPRFNLHPQLAIWGPLEARLQSADLIVLAGLNEGVWPAMPTPDPFLAPAIRRALGLPGLARRTGFQAHDVASGLGAPEVLLTRSLREGGAPAVASRFWQRLRAAAGGQLPDAGRLLPPRDALLQAARTLDRPAQSISYPRPAPAPPAADRPRSLSVTEVATLKADPFSFYARRMLGLKPLDPHDAEPSSGERGQAVHLILERWLSEGRPAEARRLEIIDEALASLGERPEIGALWKPRVIRMLDYAIGLIERESGWQPIAWEVAGKLEWRGITLKGRADRIDASASALRILDYKTGSPPTIRSVETLYQTQLALLAAIAQAGGFGPKVRGTTASLDYLQLSGGLEPGKERGALGKDPQAGKLEDHLKAAFDDFTALAAGWLLGEQPFRAKQHMVYGRRFSDFDHLARVAEWLGRR